VYYSSLGAGTIDIGSRNTNPYFNMNSFQTECDHFINQLPTSYHIMWCSNIPTQSTHWIHQCWVHHRTTYITNFNTITFTIGTIHNSSQVGHFHCGFHTFNTIQCISYWMRNQSICFSNTHTQDICHLRAIYIHITIWFHNRIWIPKESNLFSSPLSINLWNLTSHEQME